MDVKLIHIKITSVRLSHRYALDVKLIHIKSVRLSYVPNLIVCVTYGVCVHDL